MVLMPVSDYYSADFIFIFLKISEIGDYNVNAQKLAVRESKSAVDNENIVCAFEYREIFSYFVKSA